MSETNPLTRPQAVSIGDQAIPDLLEFCREQSISELLLVADQNTYAALGEQVEAALREQGADLITVIFTNEEVIADAHHILDVMVAADDISRTYLAVGSGTITDITRFVSWRTGNTFISVPTAPSVDGFTSLGAPLIIRGVKRTIISQSPRAIFADLDTLVAAPKDMIAAGFADMLGKFTSAADWRLGRLIWDEPYDEQIAVRTIEAAKYCDDQVAEIGAGSPEGIRALMEGLIESGYSMLDLGSSRNASGAEHHYSHYWEMRLLQEGRPAILHGAKVGVATVLVAQQYDRIKSLSRDQAADLLEESQLPSKEAEIAGIEAAYGDMAPPIIVDQLPFLDLTEAEYDELKRKILDNWSAIQEIAAHVPPSEHLASSLRTVGGPTTVAELGLTAEEQAMAQQFGHYLRQRFTIRKLMRVLGLG